MGQQEDERKAMATIAERVHDALDLVMSEERTWASGEGVPGETFLLAALNALLELAALTACNLLAAESEPKSEAVRARIVRVHGALAQALERIMREEMEEVGESGPLPWRGPQQGHA